ncbi:hypothetical protein PO124_27480 [Bacillus licheniformis]|nr:hypothetical protein [Bacillus licheniformis]
MVGAVLFGFKRGKAESQIRKSKHKGVGNDVSKGNRYGAFRDQIRLLTLKQLHHLGFGHYGGSLSIADVLAVCMER